MSAFSENVAPANENRIPVAAAHIASNSPAKIALLNKKGKKSPLPLERKLSKRKFSEENMDFSFGNIYDNDEAFDDSEFVSKASKPVANVPMSSSPKPAVAPKLSPMKSTSSKNWLSNLTTAPAKDMIGLEQCVLRRVRTTLMEKMYPTYEVYNSNGKLLMIARKMKLGAAYNIYAVEETATTDPSLSPKKSEYNIGKLKGITNDDYVLYNFEDDAEILAINLERVVQGPSNNDYIPRQLKIALPKLSKENKPIGNVVVKDSENETSGTSMIDSLATALSNDKYKESEPIPLDSMLFKTKCPYLKEGKYYLNFHGRVKLGSLKNFQLVRNDQNDHQETRQYGNLTMQFGKTSSDDFSMDFKYPLNYVQALGIALTQFEL